MSTGVIPNSAIIASSETDDGKAIFARVQKNLSEDTNAWSPKPTDFSAYLEVSFENPVTINSILTQGNEKDGYTSKYVVSYAEALPENPTEKIAYQVIKHPVQVSPNDEPQLMNKYFTANTDFTSIVTNTLDKPITAQRVRIHPTKTSATPIALRVDFVGCYEPKIVEPTTVKVETTTEVITKTTQPFTTTSPEVKETTTVTSVVTTPYVSETTTTSSESTTTSPKTIEVTTTKVIETTTPTEVTTIQQEETVTTTEASEVTTPSVITITTTKSPSPVTTTVITKPSE